MAKRKVRPIRIEGNVAYIPLTKGYEAVIDAADAPAVAQSNWAALVGRHTVYAVRGEQHGEKQMFIYLHRQLLGAAAETDVDHIDSDGLNNRRSNLRAATRSENNANARRRSDNGSGVKGVGWFAAGKKWRARIRIDGRDTHLGFYDTREAAHAAYEAAAKAAFGAFARTA